MKVVGQPRDQWPERAGQQRQADAGRLLNLPKRRNPVVKYERLGRNPLVKERWKVAFEVGTIGAIAQGAARLFGLSRTARLRRGINDHLKLFVALREAGLSAPTGMVGGLIHAQTRELAARESAATARQYDWDTVIGTVVLAALFGGPAWLLWQLPDHKWWVRSLAVFLGFLAVLSALSGLRGVRKGPTVDELAAMIDQAVEEAVEEVESSPPPLEEKAEGADATARPQG
jgi:hypothetical protein